MSTQKKSPSITQGQTQKNVQASNNTNQQNTVLLQVHNFFLFTDGLKKKITTKSSSSIIEVCGYLEITAQYRDIVNDQWGKVIVFKDADGIQHQYLMPNEILLLSEKDILSPLVREGLVVYSRSDTVEYLKIVQPTNRARLAHKLGWHQFNGVTCFVLPNNQVVGNTMEPIIFDGTSVTPPINSKGTLKEWQKNVSMPASSSSRSILAICVALASPLVSLGHRPNAGFHLRGNSSSGKSVAQAIGCSVIGSPDMKLTWRSTDNGLEGIALAHNDLMLPLDEISQADKNSISTAIYDLMNGKQKIRAQRNGTPQSVQGWNLLVLSSGEESLKDLASSQGRKVKAGEEIRLADIPADAGYGMGVNESLPQGFTNIQEYGTHIKGAVHEYYGTAFVEWLGVLVNLDQELFITDLNQRIKEFVNDVVPKGTSQVKRVAESFALLAIAGESATQHGITGWSDNVATQGVKTCFKAWLSEFDVGRPKEEQTLISNALNLLTMRQANFIKVSAESVPQEHIGWIDFDEQHPQVFLVPRTSYESYFCLGKKTKYVDQVLKSVGVLLDVNQSINPKSRNGSTVKVRKLVIPNEEAGTGSKVESQ